MLELARDLGLRQREAILLDAKAALVQANQTNTIKITEGTKGNRGEHIARVIPVSVQARETLEKAATLQGDNRNMIQSDKTFIQTQNEIHTHHVREVFHENNLKGFHDCRAAYACDRYKEETGREASCISGEKHNDKSDKEAREKIAHELGHGRVSVTTHYLGGRA